MRFSLQSAATILENPSIEDLYRLGQEEDACKVASNGALVAYSGKYTGRTPKDKFIVATTNVEKDIWWGNNGRMEPAVFEGLREKANQLIPGKKLYVIDSFAGADPEYRIAVRFIVERPYHALFLKQLLIRPTEAELKTFKPDWTVVNLCKEFTDPAVDHVRSEATIALNFETQEVIVFGTEYAGELKKSVFTIMNLLLPRRGVMGMHCSANIGQEGDTALFFGLSGTGKTTLSADPKRKLIGDDEHGWSDNGVFNVEGGCYAKCIKLSQKEEPEIWDAIRYGAVLENVVLSADGVPDYNDDSLTENTRAAYPIEFIENRVSPSVGGHPKNIVFLTCDALGLLPPISQLTPEQAMEMFLVGYTAKLAGTEVGVTEPKLTFSTCFGSPFMPLHPHAYADLLRKKVQQHGAKVWLINTGWTGGAYGIGHRIHLDNTRAMISAAFAGHLDDVDYVTHPVFEFKVPQTCPQVPSDLLNPRDTWPDKGAYDAKAKELKLEFAKQLKLIEAAQ